MKLDFLPQKYINALNNCNVDELYEIRLRKGFQVMVNVSGKIFYLSENGLTVFESSAFICSKEDIDEIVRSVTEYSTYAFNDKIRCGYLTTSNGVRIGIAGECVFNKGEIVTIKNITSLNVRISREVEGCANRIFNQIYTCGTVFNSLLISPPFYGKTTVLKDLIRKIDAINIGSILIIDERGEFSEIKGKNIDTIKYSDKLYAFEYGIRVMSPKIVVTDELSSRNDWICVKKAISSGVKIIASCHGKDVGDLRLKENFFEDVFDRYFILEYQNGSSCVYGREFQLL